LPARAGHPLLHLLQRIGAADGLDDLLFRFGILAVAVFVLVAVVGALSGLNPLFGLLMLFGIIFVMILGLVSVASFNRVAFVFGLTAIGSCRRLVRLRVCSGGRGGRLGGGRHILMRRRSGNRDRRLRDRFGGSDIAAATKRAGIACLRPVAWRSGLRIG